MHHRINDTINHKLVIIPEWVAQACKLENKPLSTVLDLCDLCDILTVDDVANYLAVNMAPETDIKQTLGLEFGFPKADLVAMTKQKHDNKHTQVEQIQLSASVLFASSESQNRDSHASRHNRYKLIRSIFSQLNFTGLSNNSPKVDDKLRDNYVFDLHVLNDTYIGAVVRYGNSEQELEECLVQSIVTLSQAYAFETLAQTKLFSQAVTC